MGVSTRPKRQRHQVEVSLLSSLMALFIFQPAWASTALPKEPPTAAAQAPSDLTSSLPATTAFSLVQPGEEEIELSARFTENSRNYADAVDWKVKNGSGEVLFEASAPITSVKLKPGTYEIIGHYGNIELDEGLNLPPATRLSVNFVLNAGALRILPQLPQGFGPQLQATTKVYALNGAQAGRLVTQNAKPGEMLKLAAGTYRIETHYATGNVMSVTDVEVKAGLLRAVDIAHHAGLARLSTNKRQAMDWMVMENGGNVVQLPTGQETTVLLKPGNYVVEARSAGKVLQQAFTVTDGTVSNVVLTVP